VSYEETIREFLTRSQTRDVVWAGASNGSVSKEQALSALKAFVAEYKALWGSHNDLHGRLGKEVAENQRLRDALRQIEYLPYVAMGDAESDLAATKEIARKALAGVSDGDSE